MITRSLGGDALKLKQSRFSQASDVAAMEERLAGLAAKAPAWAILRAITLLGEAIATHARIGKAMARFYRKHPALKGVTWGGHACLTLSEAAHLLKRTPEELEALVRTGVLLTVFVGRRRMFPLSEINRLLTEECQ